MKISAAGYKRYTVWDHQYSFLNTTGVQVTGETPILMTRQLILSGNPIKKLHIKPTFKGRWTD